MYIDSGDLGFLGGRGGVFRAGECGMGDDTGQESGGTGRALLHQILCSVLA